MPRRSSINTKPAASAVAGDKVMGNTSKLVGEPAIHSTSVLKQGATGPLSADFKDVNPTVREGPYAGSRIIAERTVERDILVPKMNEDGTQMSNEEGPVMEKRKVKQKVIEVAKPVVVEKVVEVPEYEYREKIVSVLEKVRQERIKEVPIIEYQERITEVPKVVYKEKEVKVPEYEYVEVVTYKDVEVVTFEEEHVIKEVVKPVLVEKPTPEYITVEDHTRIDVNVPFPVESVTDIYFELPKLNVKYRKVDVPISVPKFVEIPVPNEYFPGGYAAYANFQKERLETLLKADNVKTEGLSQESILTMENEVRASQWDTLFTNKKDPESSKLPINPERFVDEAFKNNEFSVSATDIDALIVKSDAGSRSDRDKIEAEYAKKLDLLLAEKDAAIKRLNRLSEDKRDAKLQNAFDRARRQATSNLEAAGLDPDQYLSDTFESAKAMQTLTRLAEESEEDVVDPSHPGAAASHDRPSHDGPSHDGPATDEPQVPGTRVENAETQEIKKERKRKRRTKNKPKEEDERRQEAGSDAPGMTHDPKPVVAHSPASETFRMQDHTGTSFNEVDHSAPRPPTYVHPGSGSMTYTTTNAPAYTLPPTPTFSGTFSTIPPAPPSNMMTTHVPNPGPSPQPPAQTIPSAYYPGAPSGTTRDFSTSPLANSPP